MDLASIIDITRILLNDYCKLYNFILFCFGLIVRKKKRKKCKQVIHIQKEDDKLYLHDND